MMAALVGGLHREHVEVGVLDRERVGSVGLRHVELVGRVADPRVRVGGGQ